MKTCHFVKISQSTQMANEYNCEMMGVMHRGLDEELYRELEEAGCTQIYPTFDPTVGAWAGKEEGYLSSYSGDYKIYAYINSSGNNIAWTPDTDYRRLVFQLILRTG